MLVCLLSMLPIQHFSPFKLLLAQGFDTRTLVGSSSASLVCFAKRLYLSIEIQATSVTSHIFGCKTTFVWKLLVSYALRLRINKIVQSLYLTILMCLVITSFSCIWFHLLHVLPFSYTQPMLHG